MLIGVSKFFWVFAIPNSLIPPLVFSKCSLRYIDSNNVIA